jgi:hypothetical protein
MTSLNLLSTLSVFAKARSRQRWLSLFSLDGMSIVACSQMESMFSNIIVGLLTGIIAGYFTSFLVSRRFYRKGQRDTVSTRLKACCPYRRESVRHGDGLDDTAHSLIIISEVMESAGFRRESGVVRSIASEMEPLTTLPAPEPPEQKREREALKNKWGERLSELY